MDSPQYIEVVITDRMFLNLSFKPYYKWIVLNTVFGDIDAEYHLSFKPYYKWIVLNTAIAVIGTGVAIYKF